MCSRGQRTQSRRGRGCSTAEQHQPVPIAFSCARRTGPARRWRFRPCPSAGAAPRWAPRAGLRATASSCRLQGEGRSVVQLLLGAGYPSAAPWDSPSPAGGPAAAPALLDPPAPDAASPAPAGARRSGAAPAGGTSCCGSLRGCGSNCPSPAAHPHPGSFSIPKGQTGASSPAPRGAAGQLLPLWGRSAGARPRCRGFRAVARLRRCCVCLDRGSFAGSFCRVGVTGRAGRAALQVHGLTGSVEGSFVRFVGDTLKPQLLLTSS